MQLIYLSGPISLGNRSWNLYQACEAQRILMEAGFAVINPMLTMLHPDGPNIPWQTWINGDLEIVARCDMVLRLPGESKGADIETAHAIENDIPVMWIPDGEPLLHITNWIASQTIPRK